MKSSRQILTIKRKKPTKLDPFPMK